MYEQTSNVHRHSQTHKNAVPPLLHVKPSLPPPAPTQELVLDRNRIRYIDPDALSGLPRLRELRLEENGLRSLAGFAPVARSLQVGGGIGLKQANPDN